MILLKLYHHFGSDDIGKTTNLKYLKKIYEGLQSMLGVRNDLHDGLSWTLQRTEQPLNGSYAEDVYNKLQSNSKITVAWLVMNECFLSTIDRHTRVNIAQSIVYNRRSKPFLKLVKVLKSWHISYL